MISEQLHQTFPLSIFDGSPRFASGLGLFCPGVHTEVLPSIERLRGVSADAPRNEELRTQKLKSRLMRTQSLNVLLLKPGIGQYIAIHATLTARDFFLAYFYPSGTFTCISSQTSPDFSCVG